MKSDKGEKPKFKENRTLNISNYRNLGAFATQSSPEDRTFLKINRSLDRDELGGLVILLGLNNCGKSNVLDALEAVYKRKITPEDIPDFLFESVDPKLELNVANNRLPIRQDGNGAYIIRLANSNVDEGMIHMEGRTNKIIPQTMGIIDDWIKANSNITYNGDALVVGYNSVDTTPLIEWAKMYPEDLIVMQFKNNLEKHNVEGLKEFWNLNDESNPSLESIYGYALSNKVTRYDDRPIRQSDLTCPGSSPNEFFTDLFANMGVEKSTVCKLFEYNRYGMKEKFELDYCDEFMDNMSEDFNRMLSSDPENEYRFKLKFGETKLNFVIYRGNIPLNNLDRQSEGFRWVFDFYMNFILRNDLSPGDMILMDEFGYKLNPKTIREVAELMRSIGKKEGVTFIIATQNFMIVDTSHLDEVRLVVNESNGNTKIINEFDRFGEGHDVLEPLLNAMTIGRNYLRSENRRTVFVEGMSDYFFLTAFIHHIRDSGEDVDIDILSMNGLGRKGADMNETISTLCSIERDPTILVDGDEAGKQFAKRCKGKDVTVLDLAEIMGGHSVTVIEDMFTPEERERLHLDNKEFDVNACFAQNYAENIAGLSDETRGRFKTLIDSIMLG